LVTSPKFEECDIEALKQAYCSLEEVATRNMLHELENLEDMFVADHVRALSWMLSNGLLEIRVAVVRDDNGMPLDHTKVSKSGMFHQKVGILEDEAGDLVSFSGSENESAAGWLSNIEEFKVFRSWVESEKEYLDADVKKFEKFWKGRSNKAVVLPLPQLVRERLLDLAPRDLEEVRTRTIRWYEREASGRKPGVELRDYQKEAVRCWVSNGMKGIFEMATGTGKTITALSCLMNAWNRSASLVAIIAAPFSHLLAQWSEEIRDFGIEDDWPCIVADSTNPKWRNQLADKLLDLRIGHAKRFAILTTHDTFASEDFVDLMSTCGVTRMLIVDEVHGVGAPKRRQGLLEDYEYRLGLSATPRRWFDPEGSQIIFGYFGGTVYEFPLERAIGKYLTEYEYVPHFVSLTEYELEEYVRATTKIAQAYYTSREEDRERWLAALCAKRQAVVKAAYNKYSVLEQIIANNPDITHCLIYCAPEQVERVQQILLRYGVKQHKFTQAEGTRPKPEFGGRSERELLLRRFAEGSLQALVAIKCLDEGVDIPPARYAIMMCNSGNPREHVQRTGRILRRYPGKKKSTIHDIIVVPPSKPYTDPRLAELEKRIFKNEVKRYREFASHAINRVKCLADIERLEERYERLWRCAYDSAVGRSKLLETRP